MMLSKSVHAGA